MRTKPKLSLVIIFLIGAVAFSCKSDDSRSCTTCNSDQTLEFQLCEEEDGNASVNGENTGTRYDLYLQNLLDSGANCGL